ncbi:MAG: hypothetical protein QOD06_1463 [Candidatus Binatota bacterium]|jgi:hypothetical protein|nr:hypothetical protein [Candidatus Binatota bacterium]
MAVRRKAKASKPRKTAAGRSKKALKDLPNVEAGKVIGGADSSYSTSSSSYRGTSSPSPTTSPGTQSPGTPQGYL